MSRQTIQSFYDAFVHLDGGVMERCYAEESRFDDEVFSLRGQREIGSMWRMLCDATRAKGQAVWRLEVSAVTERSAHWEATYRFSATGRMVTNIIEASFEFDAAGRIARHTDRFDFWRWSRQALGLPGLLLGWTPILRNKVRAQAAANLKAYTARRTS
jgi:SnoaL-like domain